MYSCEDLYNQYKNVSEAYSQYQEKYGLDGNLDINLAQSEFEKIFEDHRDFFDFCSELEFTLNNIRPAWEISIHETYEAKEIAEFENMKLISVLPENNALFSEYDRNNNKTLLFMCSADDQLSVKNFVGEIPALSNWQYLKYIREGYMYVGGINDYFVEFNENGLYHKTEKPYRIDDLQFLPGAIIYSGEKRTFYRYEKGKHLEKTERAIFLDDYEGLEYIVRDPIHIFPNGNILVYVENRATEKPNFVRLFKKKAEGKYELFGINSELKVVNRPEIILNNDFFILEGYICMKEDGKLKRKDSVSEKLERLENAPSNKYCSCSERSFLVAHGSKIYYVEFDDVGTIHNTREIFDAQTLYFANYTPRSNHIREIKAFPNGDIYVCVIVKEYNEVTRTNDTVKKTVLLKKGA